MSSPAPLSYASREPTRPIGQVFSLLATTLVVLSVLYGLYAFQQQQRQSLSDAAAQAEIGALALGTSLSASVSAGTQERTVAGSVSTKGFAWGALRDDGTAVLTGSRADSPAPEAFRRVARQLNTLHFPAGGEVRPDQWFDLSETLIAYRRVRGHPVTVFVEVANERLLSQWLMQVQVPLVLFALALFGLVFASAWTHRQQRAREVERDAAAALLRTQSAELRRRASLLSHTQRAAGIGGWEIDVTTGELFWTDETYRLHETTAEQFTPTVDAALAFYTSESRELIRSAIEQSMRSGQAWDVEVELVTAKDRLIWVRVTGQTELAPSGLPSRVSGTVQDVSERHRSDERIRRLAHYDELTGLPNRNLFMHHLTHAISRAERYHKGVALLFVDLDRFKVINDSLGHDMGDTVLKAIGQRLAQSMRAADLVARLGGDEYVVVAEEMDSVEAVSDVARKLKGVLEQPVACQGHELVLSGSIGIALYPQDGRDAQSLLKHADIAMYRAKEQGKNRYEFFSHGMGVTDINRLSLEATLRKAVLDQGQFVLHYQPKLSVIDGHITGAEALVRWNSPERGLVSPADFIPLAEETGLITSIGEWVLRTACTQAAAWIRKGLPPIRVAVNLSARQIYGAGFVEMVRTVLADTGVRAGCIELELTESVMMQDIQHVADLLTELKQIGVHVSVDDFGTGYSSLSYLKRLPLDALKVDRSFVRDVPSDPDDAAITRAVVALAHSLRLKVVAEGVETEAQLAFLRDLGCDEIQGFIFSKPVVAGDFEEMLRRDLRLAQDVRLDAA